MKNPKVIPVGIVTRSCRSLMLSVFHRGERAYFYRSCWIGLLRKVAENVKNQVARIAREGADEPIHGRDDRKVGRDYPVHGIQCGYQRLRLALRPQGQITQCANRNCGNRQDVRLGGGRDATGRCDDIEGQRAADRLRSGRLPGVQRTARTHIVERESARGRRAEVAVYIDDEVGVVGGEDVDGTVTAGWHDGGIGRSHGDDSVQGRRHRPCRTRWPHRQIAQWAFGYCRQVQGISPRTLLNVAGPEMGKVRVCDACRDGAPSGPVAFRVSAIRQGVTG